MADITTEQARARFATLSPTLQDAVFSVQTAEIIGLVAEKHNIPEDNIGDIAEAVGLVLLGFIHPEELAGEIATRTGIAQQVAKDVSDSLATRIFNPLQDMLDRTYAPVPHEHELAAVEKPPVIIQEIKPGESKWFSGSTPLTTRTPSPPKAAGESPVGRSIPLGEFAKLGKVSPLQAFGGKPPAVSGVEPAEAGKAARSTSSKPTEPPPVMLHEEAPLKPAPEASSFKIGVPTPKLSEVKAEKETAMPKPAVVEFGTPAAPPRPPVPPSPKKSIEEAAKTAPEQKPPARIVHYTEFRTPLGETPAKEFPSPKPPGKIPAPTTKPIPVEQIGKPPEKPAVPKTAPSATFVPGNIGKTEIAAQKIFGTQAPPNIPLAEKPQVFAEKGEFSKLETEKKIQPPKRIEPPPIKQP